MNKLILSFLFISLFLSLLFLVNREVFLTSFGKSEFGFERSTWINPNVFGGMIACGGIVSMGYITKMFFIKIEKYIIIFSIITVLFAIPTLILNASRGAFFAFCSASALFIIFSKTKVFYKICFIILIASFAGFLFYNGTFDLLIYRLNGEDSTMTFGGRRTLWFDKLKLFSEFSVLELLFGIGWSNCNELSNEMSTHNDFVTALIGFGIIGFILFLIMLLIPIARAPRDKKISVIVLTLFLMLECSVLEPIFRGYLVFLIFYFFILKYATIKQTMARRNEC